MSEGRTAAGTARASGRSGPSRAVWAWRALPHESRLAAYTSGVLFLTLFLPWYQVTLIAPAKASRLQSASATITGWGAFSFVEAAVLLVAAGVVTLLFHRAEGRAFHLPGGDGGVITAAGMWTCVLVVWRIFDKQGATTHGPSATTSGVEWGIFIALGAAGFLAYSGSRIRAAHRPEPPLPGEDTAPAGSSAAATVVLPPRPQREAPRRRRETPPARPAPTSARAPMPVPAEPSAAAPSAPAPSPPAPSAAAPLDDRPRRRATASELFERVVPDDPPTMPFGRAKRSEIEIRRTHPPAQEEQLTIPLGEDATAVLGEDATLPMAREDATLPLGEDATLPMAREDATLPLGEDATLPFDRRPERH